MTDNVALTNDDLQMLIEQLSFVIRYGHRVERDAVASVISALYQQVKTRREQTLPEKGQHDKNKK